MPIDSQISPPARLSHVVGSCQVTLGSLCAVVAVWGAAGWTSGWWPGIATPLLIGAGLAMDRRRRKHQKVTFEHTHQFVTETEQLGLRLLPVWSAQIEDSRVQTEAAISALAQRFASIVDRLDVTLKASVSEGASPLAHLFEQSSSQLSIVIESLRNAMSSNRAMHDEVRNLSQFVGELQSMAEEVANIASQTNLLAINASIEAAHAGDRGRSFGVLAQEVRKLASMSAETGRLIADKVTIVSAAITTAHEAAAASAQREAESVDTSESAIQGVLGEFRRVTHDLEASKDALKHDSAAIQGEIVESLIQLQFQDRVSQRMTHVRHSIEQIPPLLTTSRTRFETAGVLEPVDVGGLLVALQGSYAMADERAIHLGQGAATRGATTTRAAATAAPAGGRPATRAAANAVHTAAPIAPEALPTGDVAVEDDANITFF
ncbi:MAG TPA: methyl-accepting chemotaxis protein [Pararobbsia sp.]|nr:methyl-accepting chemotaxis protein [Pararobbsia sp.]